MASIDEAHNLITNEAENATVHITYLNGILASKQDVVSSLEARIVELQETMNALLNELSHARQAVGRAQQKIDEAVSEALRYYSHPQCRFVSHHSNYLIM